MDARGQVLSRHTGLWTIASFEDTFARIRRHQKLQESVGEAPSPETTAELALLEWELGILSDRQGEKAVGALESLTPDQEKRRETLRNEVRAWTILKAAGPGLKQDLGFLDSVHRSRDAVLEVGRHFMELKTSGFTPRGDELNQYFWIVLLEYAEASRDPATFAEGLEVLKSRVCYVAQSEAFYRDREARLEALRAAAPKPPADPSPDAPR